MEFVILFLLLSSISLMVSSHKDCSLFVDSCSECVNNGCIFGFGDDGATQCVLNKLDFKGLIQFKIFGVCPETFPWKINLNPVIIENNNNNNNVTIQEDATGYRVWTIISVILLSGILVWFCWKHRHHVCLHSIIYRVSNTMRNVQEPAFHGIQGFDAVADAVIASYNSYDYNRQQQQEQEEVIRNQNQNQTQSQNQNQNRNENPNPNSNRNQNQNQRQIQSRNQNQAVVQLETPNPTSSHSQNSRVRSPSPNPSSSNGNLSRSQRASSEPASFSPAFRSRFQRLLDRVTPVREMSNSGVSTTIVVENEEMNESSIDSSFDNRSLEPSSASASPSSPDETPPIRPLRNTKARQIGYVYKGMSPLRESESD